MLLLAINIIFATAIQIYQNYVSKDVFKNKSDYIFYMLMVYAFSALATFVGNGFNIGEVSAFAIIDGMAYGILLPAEAFCLLQALSCGAMSITSLCITASIMIPIIPSWIFWGDPISWNQIVGMLIMFSSMALLVNVGSDLKKDSINRKWIIYCLIAFIGSGLAQTTEKVLKVSPYAEQETAFLIATFVTGSIFTSVALAINIFVKKEKLTINMKPAVLAPMAAVGVSTWVCGLLVLSCLALLPASVFFTINNGARLICLTIVDVIFFKQKITPKQYAGLILGIVGIALLGL